MTSEPPGRIVATLDVKRSISAPRQSNLITGDFSFHSMGFLSIFSIVQGWISSVDFPRHMG